MAKWRPGPAISESSIAARPDLTAVTCACTAIGHAAAAGEMLWAARIIEQHFDLVFYIRGEAATIDRWMSVLPDEVVRSRPRLLLAQAIMAATSGHFEVVEPLLDAVACAPPGWADEPFEPAGGAAASNLINVPALTTLVRSFVAQYQGDAEATVAFATQTLAEIKPGERLLSANAHVSWPSPNGCAVGLPRPNAASRPASPGGVRPASSRWPRGATTRWC